MFEGMILNMVKPHLNKIPAGLKSMAAEYGVEDCMLLIRSNAVLKEGKVEEEAIIMFVAQGPKGLSVCKDKDGNRAEYPIEKLLSLITGE